jgi:hypothetical protein
MAKIGGLLFDNRPWYMPKMRALRGFWDDKTGLAVFRDATNRLSAGRKLDAPCVLVQEGALMRPIAP